MSKVDIIGRGGRVVTVHARVADALERRGGYLRRDIQAQAVPSSPAAAPMGASQAPSNSDRKPGKKDKKRAPVAAKPEKDPS